MSVPSRQPMNAARTAATVSFGSSRFPMVVRMAGVLCVAALSACAGAPASSVPSPGDASTTGEQYALLAMPASSAVVSPTATAKSTPTQPPEQPPKLPANLAVHAKSSKRRVMLVRGTPSAIAGPVAPWQRIATLGTKAHVDKIHPLNRLLAGMERAPLASTVAVFLQVDRAFMPDETLLRDHLTAAGFVPSTVAGDVVTGSLRLAGLGALLRIPWLTRVRLPMRLRRRPRVPLKTR